MKDLARELLRSLDEKALISLAQEMMRIPSPTGREAPLISFLEGKLREVGCETERQEIGGGRANLMARFRGEEGGRCLLFHGHCDTVPEGDMEDAFSGEIRGGKLYGRGAADMKGAIAAMVGVMSAVSSSRIKPKGEILLVGTVDEEKDKLGIQRLLKDGLRADFAINGEPTDLKIAIGQKGCVGVKITTRGRATHGANPEKGVNAIVHMARLIERLNSMPMPSFELPGLPPVRGTANVSLIEGGIMFMAVPPGCSIWVDRRTVPGESTEKILGEYRDLVKSLKTEEKELEAEVRVDRPDSQHPSIVKRGLLPFITPPEEEVVGAVREGFREVLGREGELSFLQCWTEADFFVNEAGIPTVLFGPGRLENAHSAEEHVALEDLVAAAKVYLLALARLLG